MDAKGVDALDRVIMAACAAAAVVSIVLRLLGIGMVVEGYR